MSKTLDDIRKKLQSLDRKGPSGVKDKAIYPHWNIPEGTTTILRFLPDANPDNPFFWSEKQIIKLVFPGIKGQDEGKEVEVQVPCIEMWDGKNTCPILNEVRPWWKDKSLEDLARKYWVKRSQYMQGFVKQDPSNEADSPENPIRKFIMGPQLFTLIKASLMDPEMEHSPVDYINGLDFLVSKTTKGGFSDYGTSKWARKETSLSEEMQNSISQYGLVDLATYLPKRPTPEQLAIIYDMFQASVDGELYDPEKWSQHYKPYGFDSNDDSDGTERQRVSRSSVPVRPVASIPAVVSTPVVDNSPPFDVDEPSADVKEAVTATPTKSPQDILAMLRNRNKQ